MENQNGALAFDVLIRDNNLEQMLSKDEQRIAQFTQNVEDNSQSIVNSFGAIGAAVGGIAVGAMLKGWVSDVVKVRGEFQQLEIAFTTILGNTEKSTALMKQLTETAIKTPFDLIGVAHGAKQLLAYGESAENVNDTLIRLGNIASGLSLPLNDLVYLYGTTMVQGRLFAHDVRQFMGRGIPLIQELSKMLGKTTEEITQMVTEGKIGFPEVQKVIESLTNSSGMFYNLMEEQSKSLTGQIANLGDAWGVMLNDIGESNEGVLGSGIELATNLVENYGKVLDVLKGIVMAYGTYKAALIALSIAQNKSTGFASIDRIVAKSRLGVYTSLSAQTQNYTRKNELMTKAQQAYTIELQKSLSLEQQENILRGLKVGAIQGVLTAEQQVYLSRLNLNTQSIEYIAAAESILTIEQRLSLQKQELGRTSMAYSVAIENELRANQAANASEMARMQTEARALKQKAILIQAEYRTSLNKIQQTRVQISLAKLNGDAMAVENLELQQHNQLKAHAAIVTDLKNTKTAHEAVTTKISTTATRQATLAGKGKVAGDVMQAASTSMLSSATTFLTAKLRGLWATMMANPFTAILSVLGLAISAFTMFRKETEESIDVAKEFESQTKKEIDSINLLRSVLQNSTAGTETHQKALEKLNGVLSSHNLEVIKEGDNIKVVTDRYNELTEAIGKNTAQRLMAQKLEELATKQSKDEENALENLKKGVKGIKDSNTSAQGTAGSITYATPQWVHKLEDEYFDYIYSNVKDRMVELENLPVGSEAYNNKLQDIQRSALKMMRDATGATEDEIKRSSEFIEKFVHSIAGGIDNVTRQAQATREGLERMAKGLEDAKDDPKEKIDLMTLSLEALHKELDDLNGKKINFEIGSTDYDELLKQIEEVDRVIAGKQAGLNTEAGINDEIKRLKAAKEQSIIGDDDWKKLDKKIKELQGKLDAVSVKEKSGKDAFLEKLQKYKEEYQRFFKWINSGDETIAKAASDEFDGLLKEGATYLDYLERQRANLESIDKDKRSADQNDRLRELNNQIAEEAKTTVLEAFNTELAEQLGNAESIIEVLKIIEQRRVELANDGTQIDNLKKEKLDDVEKDTLKKQQEESKALMETYASVLDQRERLYEKYLYDIALLEKEKENATSESEKQQINRTISYRKEKYNEDKANLLKPALEATKKLINIDKEGAILNISQKVFKWEADRHKAILEERKKAAIKTLDELEKLQSDAPTDEIASEIANITREVERLSDEINEIPKEKFGEILSGLQKITGALGGMDGEFGELFAGISSQLGNLEVAFDSTASKTDKVSAAISSTIEIINMLTSASAKRDKAEREFFQNKIALAHEYALALNEQLRIQNDLAGGGFVTDYAGKIEAGFSALTDASKNYQEAIAKLSEGKAKVDLSNAIDWGNVGKGAGAGAAAGGAIGALVGSIIPVVGTSVVGAIGAGVGALIGGLAGLFGGKKKKDEYGGLMEVFPDLVNGAGELNKELAQTLLSTKQVDEETRQLIQDAIDWNDAMEAAHEQIKGVVVELAGDLGGTLRNSIVGAWKAGEDASKSMFDAASESLEKFVENMIYSTLFSDVFKEFGKRLTKSIDPKNGGGDILDDYEWLMGEMEARNATFRELMDKVKKRANDRGFNAWEDKEKNRESLSGAVKNVTQETASIIGGEIMTVRIRQAEHLLVSRDIRATSINVQNSLKDAVVQLNTIASNTSHNKNLIEIKEYLKDMREALKKDNLRAKGYNI